MNELHLDSEYIEICTTLGNLVCVELLAQLTFFPTLHMRGMVSHNYGISAIFCGESAICYTLSAICHNLDKYGGCTVFHTYGTTGA